MSQLRTNEDEDREEKRPLLSKTSSVTSSEEDKQSAAMFQGKVGAYQLYVLIIFLATYLLNQLDRYMLAITVKPMAQELHFGDQACQIKSDFSNYTDEAKTCNATKADKCEQTVYNVTNTTLQDYPCKWDYNGQGIEYQLVAGPVFIVIYTFAGIFISFAADKYNRKMMLAACLIWWSAMTILTGFIKEYWQLVILRFGLGFGEAGCTPFVASMLTDIYPAELRGTALGVYNWGIYMGYSMSYALGNTITAANINGQGWRWAFFISGIPGVAIGILMILSVREPERKSASKEVAKDDAATPPQENIGVCQKLGIILRPFLAPSLIIAVLAGSVRNAAGYVFAYNTQPYFISIHQTKEDIAKYMGWIPIVGGSLGVLVGGFISDRVVKGRGIYARVAVVIVSLLVAAPFAAGTLYFDPPYAYICQIPCYLFGEMWIGITLAIVVEIVPANIRTSAVAVYLFIISNIGGNMPLLVPPIREAFEAADYTKSEALRGALYILYPGLYVLGAVMFIPAMLLMKRDQAKIKEAEYVTMENKTSRASSLTGGIDNPNAVDDKY